MNFFNKKGGGNPIWSLISLIFSVVIILALLNVLGIKVDFVDFIMSGFQSLGEIISDLKEAF